MKILPYLAGGGHQHVVLLVSTLETAVGDGRTDRGGGTTGGTGEVERRKISGEAAVPVGAEEGSSTATFVKITYKNIR
jgi:hypothetical protein